MLRELTRIPVAAPRCWIDGKNRATPAVNRPPHCAQSTNRLIVIFVFVVESLDLLAARGRFRQRIQTARFFI